MPKRNRWTGLVTLVFLALTPSLGWADESPSAAPPTAGQTQSAKADSSPTEGETLAPASIPEEDSETHGTYVGSDPANLYFSLGPGLLLWNDNAGASLDLVAAIRLSKTVPLFFGADVGYNYFRLNTTSAVPTGVVVNGIQLLPTIFYEWEISHVTRFHPYAGISAGVNVLYTTTSGKTALKPSYIVQRGKFTAGEFLFRPGMRIDITKELSFATEVRWGILKADLIVCPETSFVFSL